MSLEIITVQKSLSERLDEISCIFSGRRVTVTEVQEKWINFIQMTLRNNDGWQAIWKIPRGTCEDLEINYPTAVFVEVNGVNYEELTANVTIVAAEDDVELPEQQEASLLHLFPTVQQQISSISIVDIAHCLDNYRFFYNNIWQSWDDDDDDKNLDWVANCLEPRMKLFRDMQAGLIGPLTVAHTRRLLHEAKNLYKLKLSLELRQLDDEIGVDETVKKSLALEQMELQYQLDLVKYKIAVVENPFLREKAIEYHLQKQRKIPETQKTFIVWDGGKCDELVALMNEACSAVSDMEDVRPCNLKTALEHAGENDTVFLCKGVHKINSEMFVSRNGTFRGFPSSADVILTLEQPGLSLFDWGGAKLKFSGLTLSGHNVQTLLTIRAGTVELHDCQLTGDPRNVVTGLCIMSGSIILMNNCQLSGFDTGIVVKNAAALQLIHCSITSCSVGIEIHEGGEMDLRDCHVLNCLECGLLFRTNKEFDPRIEGSVKILNSYQSLNIENIVLEGNCRDVHLSPN